MLGPVLSGADANEPWFATRALAFTGFLLLLQRSTRPGREPWRALASAALVGAAALVTVGPLGRAPVAVAIAASLLGSSIARTFWLGIRTEPVRVRGTLSFVTLVATVAIWTASSSNAMAAAGFAFVGALALVDRRRPSALEHLDLLVTDLHRRAAPSVGRMRSAMARSSDRLALHALARCRGVGRHVRSRATLLRSPWRPTLRPAATATLAGVTLRRANVLAAAAIALAMGPVFHRLARDPTATSNGFTDYTVHLEAVAETGLIPFTTLAPHWLFHVLVALVRPVTGPEVGTGVVLGLACGALVLLLGELGVGRSLGGHSLGARSAAAVAVVAVVAESPTALANGLGLLEPARAFAPFHAWGNPTDVLAVPLALALLISIVAFAAEDHRRWWQPTSLRTAMMVLAVAAALTKPNLPMTFLVVTPVYLLLRGSLRRTSALAYTSWFVVPSVAVLVLQYVHLTTSEKIARRDPGGWGLTIDPFSFLDIWPAAQGGAWFWIGPIILLLGAWSGGRRYFTEPLMLLTHLVLGFSLLIMVLFRETGLRAPDGNFMKAAYQAQMILVLLTIVFLSKEIGAAWVRRRHGDRLPLWAPLGVAFLSVAVLSGGALYLDVVAPHLVPAPTWPLLPA